ATGTRSGTQNHAVQVTDMTVADEHFSPIEDIPTGHPFGGCGHTDHVPAGLWLGDRDRRHATAVANRG
ncbi:hypothetical protein BG015_008174, partial [Linnemannia schmuckeri]